MYAIRSYYGWFDSSAPWTVLDAEFSKYVSLGETEKFRQRVLALDVWTADALTWDSSHTEGGNKVFNRSPVANPEARKTVISEWRARVESAYKAPIT